MPLTKRQWKNLLHALKNDSCILMLGPSVSTALGGKETLAEKFALTLTEELEREEVTFDINFQKDLTYIMQRFLTIESVMPNDPGFEAKSFFKKHATEFNTTQKILAKLPFYFVVNTSPDDLIAKAMKEEGGKYKTSLHYYNFRKEQKSVDDIPIPTAEEQVVFNLFGHYEDHESLVLTEADQIGFISSVVRDNPPLPPKILRQFDALKTYLFLGFNWEEWHLRMLMDSLNLKNESSIFSPSLLKKELRNRTKDFYKSQFRFEFVTEGIEDFVLELKERYDTYQSESTIAQQFVIASVEANDTFRDKLYTHLLPLKNKISTWHYGLIPVGDEVENIKMEYLDVADRILLIVSSDMIASDELDFILKYRRRVIPIIAKNCAWDEIPELTKCSTILPIEGNTPGKPINTWENKDEAFQNIVQELLKLI